MGHTDATFEEAMSAAKDGVNHATHLFNAMSALAHRNPGVVGAALASDNVSVEVIADTFHINPGLYSIVSKVKGDKMVLITDCTRAGGMPDGEYDLGGLPVMVANGAARLKEGGALAGSTLQLATAFKNICEVTGLKASELVKSTSASTAAAMGWNDRGYLMPGYLADIVLLDADFNVCKTMVGGEIRFAK
jgi:N-acetylglucosamine-6-phosphate deacetylase